MWGLPVVTLGLGFIVSGDYVGLLFPTSGHLMFCRPGSYQFFKSVFSFCSQLPAKLGKAQLIVGFRV